MDWLINILRSNPVIPIFLTLGLGFWIGKMKFRSFSLGPVAATLIMGVIIGQIQIQIPDLVKSVFFTLFLFSIGYSVGPQFFSSFRGAGVKQVIFAFVEAAICASTVILAAKLMGYNTGMALGLFAGSQTASASLGVSSETIRGLAMSASEKDYLLSVIPACYAVTYVFGTAGSAWFLSSVGPMLLGGLEKVRAEAQAIEAEMDGGEFQPSDGYIVANRPVSFRAFRLGGDYFRKPRTIEELETHLSQDCGSRIYVERIRKHDEMLAPTPRLKLHKGDTVVLAGRRENMVELGNAPGKEVTDHELMNFDAENLPVTIAKGEVDGQTLGELRKQPYMRGVFVRSITRNNVSLPARAKTPLHPGDVLVLVGLPEDVTRAARKIGYSDRHTKTTDMVFLGFGIASGCFIGALSFHIHGVPIALSASGGALLAGLFLGWLRNSHPTFGRIPSPVIWIFDNLGLNMFIAVVGLTSGGKFLAALKEAGIGLFFIGIVCTLIALTINIFIASKLFRFSAPETLGCVAGARCGVASIGAIQDALESSVPAIGYTVCYAVANLVLVFSSLLVLAFT